LYIIIALFLLIYSDFHRRCVFNVDIYFFSPFFANINWAICCRILRFLSITFPHVPWKALQGPTIINDAFRAFTEIHNGVTWWFYGKLSSAMPPASFLSCHLECRYAFHHSFVHDPISEWLSTLWLLSYFHKWRWLDGKWTERTARLMKRKDGALPRGRTRRISSLSTTARVKGSFSKSLVKSATYSVILSSVEVIHDKEQNAVSW